MDTQSAGEGHFPASLTVKCGHVTKQMRIVIIAFTPVCQVTIMSALGILTHLIFTFTSGNIKKQRHKDIEWLGQDHTESKRWSWAFNPKRRPQRCVPAHIQPHGLWVDLPDHALEGERLALHSPTLLLRNHHLQLQDGSCVWRSLSAQHRRTSLLVWTPDAQLVTRERRRPLSDFHLGHLRKEGKLHPN